MIRIPGKVPANLQATVGYRWSTNLDWLLSMPIRDVDSFLAYDAVGTLKGRSGCKRSIEITTAGMRNAIDPNTHMAAAPST